MPSPIGHALAGFAVGWVVSPPECRSVRPWASRLAPWRWPLAFAGAGMVADVDLLVGLHSQYTHSVGAVAIIFGLSWLALRGRATRPVAAALALAVSYGSHILLDFLGSDTAPPLGIMALWPLSDQFYLSPVPLFMGISRRYWLAAIWMQNAVSVAREVFVLLPLAAVALWFRPGVRSET